VAKDYTERIRSDNKNMELIYDQKDANRPILVKVDRGRITQVISNILNNALNFQIKDRLL
jgi:signal transduction histidine kinase